MSTQVTTAFVQQFGANFAMLAQQKGSRLRAALRNETVVGTSAFFDQIGVASAQARGGRHSNTPQIDTPHSRRMVTMSDYEWADLIDQADKVRMLADPTSSYAMAGAMAMGRSIDDVIIAAATGTATTGVAGGTNTTLPNTQRIVPTDGTTVSAFQVATLLRVKKLFDDADVDEDEERYIALSSQQLQDLLSDVKIQSHDYNTVRALVSGQIDTFMGFKFIRSQRLLSANVPVAFDKTTGLCGSGASTMTNARSVIAWAKSGMLLGLGQDIKARISERDDKGYSTQVYASMTIGATRMEETKVVQVYCKESNSVVA
jgi:hypothetical protein